MESVYAIRCQIARLPSALFGIGAQPLSVSGFVQIACSEGKNGLNGIFFCGLKNEAIQLQKCRANSKPCSLISVDERVVANNAGGVQSG